MVKTAETPTGAEPELSHLVSVKLIDFNPYQPRKSIDPEKLEELVGSVRNHGVIQPLITRVVDGRRQLIAGERRLRAAREAGLTVVPVVDRTASDEDMADVAFIENIQREDLNVYDTIGYLVMLRDERQLSEKQIIARTGMSQARVQMYFKCHDKLDDKERQQLFEQCGAGYSTVAKVADVHPEDRNMVIQDAISRGGVTRDNVVAAIKSTNARTTGRRRRKFTRGSEDRDLGAGAEPSPHRADASGAGAGAGADDDDDDFSAGPDSSNRPRPAWTKTGKVNDLLERIDMVSDSGPDGTGACTKAEVDAAAVLRKYFTTNIGAALTWERLAALLNQRAQRTQRTKKSKPKPAVKQAAEAK
jgi:ParB/RepB/Spo0J family partition protein